jgi:glycosyltransferase involved in cell wall biosynthesis
MIGRGPRLTALQDRVVQLGIQQHVTFAGFIADQEETRRLVSRTSVGLAPATFDPQSLKLYADISKLKTYMAYGLPVITTTVATTAREIEQQQAGIIIPPNDPDALAAAIVQLLSDDDFHHRCRENAIQMAQRNTWEHHLNQVFTEMGLLVDGQLVLKRFERQCV